MDEGATRAADGSIDRVPDPPESLRPFLLSLKKMAKAHGIDLEHTFQNAGATRYGTISKRKFQAALVVTFERMHFSEQQLFSIVSAYGCGAEDIYNDGKQDVAWRDFVKDVKAADDTDDDYRNDALTDLSRHDV